MFLCGLALLLLLGVARRKAAPVPDNVTLETGIVFGKGADQPLLLDMTRPKQGKGPFPALLFVHGGGWGAGTRDSFRSPMFYFSQRGFVCVTVDYRLAPRYKFPAPLEDIKCAVRWLRANARTYDIDPERIGAVGGSAGAHLVALLGTTAGQKRWEGSGGNADQSSAIRAMACLSGPYDLERGYRNSVHQRPSEGGAVRGMLESFLGGTPDTVPAQYRDASPIHYASKATIPTLLTHGTADPLVLIEQSDRFYQALKNAGASDVELLRIEGAGHADFGKKPQEVLARCDAFLQKHLK